MSAVRDTSSLRTFVAVSLRDASGLRVIKTLSVRDSSGQHQVFSSAGIISASPTDVSGFANAPGAVTIVTNSTKITAPSGSTISWAFTSGTGTWAILSPTSFTTAFRSTAGPGVERDAIFTATVTLPRGGTATCTVSASVENVHD